MITLDVTTDDRSGIAGYLSGLRAQMPYAQSVAINSTIKAAQAAVRQTLPAEFLLRRASFIEQTVYIAPGDFAKKDKLEGTVRINPARDFLAKFELGGIKKPLSGKSLAVPVFRQAAPGIIIQRSDPLNVKMLMAAITAGHGKVLRARINKKAGTLQVTADKNKVYLIESAKGTFIIQRTGRDSTRVLYVFEHSVRIKPELHFDETALSTALATWDANWTAALGRAIATMR